MRKDRGIFIDQPVKNFDRQLEFDGTWHINESAGADLGTMERGKLGRTENSRLGHEMFAHEIFVLDQSSLERLKNNTSPAQRFRKGVTLEQLIVRENQTPRFAIERRRSFKDFDLLIVGRCITQSIGRKIERTDVGKSPGLIFARRIGRRGKFAPALFLLLLKPPREITRTLLRRGDDGGIYGRRLCHFLKDSSSVAHFARPKMRSQAN